MPFKLLLRAGLLLCFCSSLADPLGAFSQSAPAGERDGRHDFDFAVGVWKPQISRLLHPLTGSKSWVKYEGRTMVRKVWNGRAQLVELQADSSAGHVDLLCLRLYNPQTHQWSLNYANSAEGVLGSTVIGEFHDGRGQFFGHDELNGKPIFVRNVISGASPTSMHLEQAYSADGGKTWETNFVETLTRIGDNSTDSH